MSHQKQHGVTIGGQSYRVDENGKFVKVEEGNADDKNAG